MMRILLASSNPHKLEEIQAVLVQLRAGNSEDAATVVEVVGMDTLTVQLAEPVEDAPTFEANAQLKALYYAGHCGLWCLADDSGLEVDALNGAPGVRSARYAQLSGPRSVVDPANNALLLRNLGDLPAEKRSARFVCAMALAAPAGVLGQAAKVAAVVRGEVAGRIIAPGEAARGEHGFGYDPLFVIAERGKTTAELPPEEKNAISHRGRAVRKMWPHLLAAARQQAGQAGGRQGRGG